MVTLKSKEKETPFEEVAPAKQASVFQLSSVLKSFLSNQPQRTVNKTNYKEDFISKMRCNC